MKRLISLSRTLLATASLSMFACAAFAQGINLSWTDCGTNGQLQRNFACASNTGTNLMVLSAVTGVAMPQLNGQSSVVDLQTNEATLSDWWTFGGCRVTGNISADFNIGVGPPNCVDPWQTNPSGGLTYGALQGGPGGGPNTARIRTLCAISGNIPIDGVTEYGFVKINISNARSTGTGSCAGCADGACIVFQSLLVTQPLGVGDYILSNPLERRHILWQAGGSAIGGLGCPNEVPTRNKTWGSVKSLYR